MISTSIVDPGRIAEACRHAIVEHGAQSERDRRLPGAVVEQLRAARAFALLTPVEWGGLELSLGECSAVYEAFARIDAAVAWNVWNGNVGFSAAMLEPAAAEMIWGGGRDPIVANSTRPAGVATPEPGGFRLSGRWDIVSAIDIADWVVLFGIVTGSNAPDRGSPDLRTFYVPRHDVAVLDTWHTSGMRPTGSNSVVVDGLHVGTELVLNPFAPARIDRPLYRIPAFTLASTGGASILIGVAQAALDELAALAAVKVVGDGTPMADQPRVTSTLGHAQTALDAPRALLEQTTTAVDVAAGAGEAINVTMRGKLRAAMSHAAATSRSVLVDCYQLASSTAVYVDNPIERIVRDGLVACQHTVFSPTLLDARGRLLAGLDHGEPVL